MILAFFGTLVSSLVVGAMLAACPRFKHLKLKPLDSDFLRRKFGGLG